MNTTDITDLLRMFDRVRERTLRVVACIPLDQLEWSPRAGMFTFGDIVRHIVAIGALHVRRECSRQGTRVMRRTLQSVTVPIEAPIPFQAIPLLSALREEDREALAPLCRIRGYGKGETIFHEGEPADRIHFVQFGRVKIVKAAGGRDVILEILGPGEPVGAVAVFVRKPFPASAVALEPSGIVSIPERDFFALLEKRPEMSRHLLAGLTQRLMTVNKRLADMTGSVERRTARLFLTLADRVGIARADSVEIPLALSRQEIADLIGTTLETAIRVMSRWQKDSVVFTEKSGFRIPDLSALRNLTSD